MNKIRVHNPCNEKTRYLRYYNFFWDKFTDFLKTKFDVIENRYFKFAEQKRFRVFLEKGKPSGFEMLECEYIVENLETGEFIILSAADDLYGCALKEIENPYLKKVLLSQFIPQKIKSSTNNFYYKYEPWTYFQYSLDDLEFYRNKRKKIENKIDKMFFQGDVRIRPILKLFDSDLLLNPERNEPSKYFDEVIKYKIGLSLSGVGEMCYRDIEFMSMEVPFIRMEYQTKLTPPLIPNYHYISIPLSEVQKDNGFIRDGYCGEELSKKIEKRFNEVKNNKEFLEFITKNARKYYDDNLTLNNLISNTFYQSGIFEWIK